MWAYFPDKESAVAYLEKIETYFENVLAVI